MFFLASDYFLAVTSEEGTRTIVKGPLLSPEETATSLPSILLPPELVGTNSDGSLNSALSASITYTSITFQASSGGGTEVSPGSSKWPYLNLTLAAQALSSALPAAVSTLSGGSAASALSSAEASACTEDSVNCAASTAVASAAVLPDTSLTNFMSTILPALPAVTNQLPSVGSGQFVQAGMSALLATVIAFVGFAPNVNSSQVLAALSSSLNAALEVAPY